MRRQTTATTPVVLDMKGPEDLHVINTISDAIGVNDGQTSRWLARAEGVWAALREAGFEIVRKDEGGKPIISVIEKHDDRTRTSEKISDAVHQGDWDGVSLQDIQKWSAACQAGYMSRDDVIRRMGGDPAKVDRKIAEERARAHALGLSFPGVALEAGNVIEVPPGTEIRSADPAAQEPDNWGLPERCADDHAERYGCRVAIVGLDDARLPLSDEDSDKPHAVVTERATGRIVGLVEAWISDDGDPIVPRTWLEIVLSAWSAARDPQRAA